MFIISETNVSGYTAMRTETNNIRDIYDIVLNVTNDDTEAKLATETAGIMSFGEQVERSKYKLECIRNL